MGFTLVAALDVANEVHVFYSQVFPINDLRLVDFVVLNFYFGAV